MNDFMINLFIPYGIDGSVAAITSHIYAKENNGAVSIVRYLDEDSLNKSVGELMRHITVADGCNAPQPKFRTVWIVGHVNEMINDELEWFSRFKHGRKCVQVSKGSYLYIGEMFNTSNQLPSLLHFLYHLTMHDDIGKNIELLYKMLDADEFEHLVAHLLQEHPYAEDITQEDYVLNLFVEHERKVRSKDI